MADTDAISSQKPSLANVPTEIILEITKWLEPEPEEKLDPLLTVFSGIFWFGTYGPEVDEMPTIEHLRSANLPAWQSYRDIRNLALVTGGQAHPLRVCILYTGVQLARLFALLILKPELKSKIEKLQLHNYIYCFTQAEENRLRATIADIRYSSGLDILDVAEKIYQAAGHGSVLEKRPHIVISMALLHILPAVKIILLPYPRNYLTPRDHLQSLDLQSDFPPLNIEVSVAQVLLPLEVRPFRLGQLKELNLTAVAHYQNKHYTEHGELIDKDPSPFDYWTTLCSHDVFSGLQKLTLNSIGDPGPSPPPNGRPSRLSMPNLKILRLHSVNMDERNLMAMLRATPYLEELQVFFAIDNRFPTFAADRQEDLDYFFTDFPKSLKTLVLVYLLDRFNREAMWPRVRLFDLSALANLENLGIDISSLVSPYGPEPASPDPLPPRSPTLSPIIDYSAEHPDTESENTMCLLPPSLRRLQLYSCRDTCRDEMNEQHPALMVGIREPLQWEFLQYKAYLRKFEVEMRRQFAKDTGHGLAEIQLVMPLFFDEAIQEGEPFFTRWDLYPRPLSTDDAVRLAEQYQREIPREMRRVGDNIARDCGVQVDLALSIDEQMGGAKAFIRRGFPFWHGDA